MLLQCTLVFVFDLENRILLAMKKRGFGAGKWNGAGGKIDAEETVTEAAVRELHEETGVAISPESLEPRGILHYHFLQKPEWDRDVHVFVSHGYKGGFQETEEMRPEWFDIDAIPFDAMWNNDRYWLPRVIEGESVEFEFYI